MQERKHQSTDKHKGRGKKYRRRSYSPKPQYIFVPKQEEQPKPSPKPSILVQDNASKEPKKRKVSFKDEEGQPLEEIYLIPPRPNKHHSFSNNNFKKWQKPQIIFVPKEEEKKEDLLSLNELIEILDDACQTQ
jgi:hypothetical protein